MSAEERDLKSNNDDLFLATMVLLFSLEATVQLLAIVVCGKFG